MQRFLKGNKNIGAREDDLDNETKNDFLLWKVRKNIPNEFMEGNLITDTSPKAI